MSSMVDQRVKDFKIVPSYRSLTHATLWCYFLRLLHLSKPGISTGVVPTAAAAAASLMSDGGGTTL